MTYEEAKDEFVRMRGVQTPCRKCQGLGTIMYGSTSTWHGGIGGAAMTNGICNHCWGSGDEHLHWLNLKQAEPILRKAQINNV